MEKYTSLIAVLIMLFFSLSFAQIPNQMNYQGYLTDNAGNPLTGNHKLTFTIYDAQTGGNTLWMEEHPSVAITSGVFRVQLGSITALNLDFDMPYWLSIKVENDPELAPRIALACVPYSFRAHKADSLSEMPHIYYQTPWFFLPNITPTFQSAVVGPFMGTDLVLHSQTLVAQRDLYITGCQIGQDDDGNGDTYHLFITRDGTYVGGEFTLSVPTPHKLYHVDLSEPVLFQKGQQIGLAIKSEDNDSNGEEVFILLDGYCTH